MTRLLGQRFAWQMCILLGIVVVSLVGLLELYVNRPRQDPRLNDANCAVHGEANVVKCSDETEVPGQSVDAILRADARRFVNVPPTGQGPWPFAVVGTFDVGLKVRSTNAADGKGLGGLAPHHIAWAVCQHRSAFDPDPTTGTGPIWLKVKWEQQEPSTAFFDSDPSATATAWVYRGFLIPVGHNGNIPDC